MHIFYEIAYLTLDRRQPQKSCELWTRWIVLRFMQPALTPSSSLPQSRHHSTDPIACLLLCPRPSTPPLESANGDVPPQPNHSTSRCLVHSGLPLNSGTSPLFPLCPPPSSPEINELTRAGGDHVAWISEQTRSSKICKIGASIFYQMEVLKPSSSPQRSTVATRLLPGNSHDHK
jgi:hypothetical protein